MSLGLVMALAAVPAPPPTLPAARSGSEHAGLWKLEPASGVWQLTLEATNFNGDRVASKTALHQEDVDAAMSEFGFLEKDRDAVYQDCLAARCRQAEYERKLGIFYEAHGVHAELIGDTFHLGVNMPRLVKDNAPRMKALAVALQEVARTKGYGVPETVGAGLSLLQTAIDYYEVPDVDNGKDILGLWVPPQVLLMGKGDCDSKTGALASVMRNFSGLRLVGVQVPGHYLMGFAAVPQPGQTYLEFRGLQFVLIEPAGPAWWPPGHISEHSQASLDTMQGVRVDPFFDDAELPERSH